MALYKKQKVKFCFNKMVPTPLWSWGTKVPTVNFLISGPEEAHQYHGPHEVQTSHQQIFLLWGLIKILIHADII